MSVEGTQDSDARGGNRLAPDYLAHWVVKTARADEVRLEFQTENFATPRETAEYILSSAFADNPIGVNFDPGYLLERLRSGDDPAELCRQGAGTRPGARVRANKRALTWKAL